MQWIELPETATSQFGLSSLFLGEREGRRRRRRELVPPGRNRSLSMWTTGLRAARRCGFRLTFTMLRAVKRDRTFRLRLQVLRNREPIMRIAPSQVPLTNDPARLPYWSEIALQDLPPGHYVLLLTATDQNLKSHCVTTRQLCRGMKEKGTG